MRSNLKNGYSLTELITVIAIIGILATVIVGSLSGAREKGKIAHAQEELLNIRGAIGALLVDTKKYPNGCTSIPADYEVELDNPQAGIATTPSVGVVGTDCEWTARDVYLWNGPYLNVPKDPWGNPYIFDPDYFQGMDCPDSPYYFPSHDHGLFLTTFPGVMIPALVSNGPNGAMETGFNTYDCDDIFIPLR